MFSFIKQQILGVRIVGVAVGPGTFCTWVDSRSQTSVRISRCVVDAETSFFFFFLDYNDCHITGDGSSVAGFLCS